MILQYPSVTILPSSSTYHNAVCSISTAAGLCYNKKWTHDFTKSNGVWYGPESAPVMTEREEFIRKCTKAGHESVIEHACVSVLFEVDRGITHEMVRHLLCSFTQSSTRYCDYTSDKEDGHVKFIIPPWVPCDQGMYNRDLFGIIDHNGTIFTKPMAEDDSTWLLGLLYAEECYKELRKQGWGPEMARNVLPHSTAANIVWTANLREWRHILKLRALGTTGRPHPQMEEVMIPLLDMMKKRYPIFFEDMELPKGDGRFQYNTICKIGVDNE